MAEAKFSLGQVNITDYLRVIAREVTSPLAEVSNVVYPPPQPTTRNIVVTDLNPVMHYFDFYESADGIAQGTLLATFTIDVGLINPAPIEFIEFTVGGSGDNDPAAGSDTYINTDLDGEEYQVSQRGVGPRSFVDELSNYAGGGFQLLNGETFNAQDRWFIVVAKLSTTHATVTSRGMFRDVIEITANVTIGITHYNCMLEANASGTILTATVPALATIPEDTIFGFSTHFGPQRYFAIQLQSGENIRSNNGLKNIIWLAKNETITIIKKGSLLKILERTGDYLRVGEKVKNDIAPVNGLAETGGWYNIADYPRFFYEFVNLISPGHLSTFTGDTVANRTKFAIDNSGARFWMRDTGGYFERNADPDGNIDTYRDSGERYPGTTQATMIKKHKHVSPWGENPGATAPFGSVSLNQRGMNAYDFDNKYWLTDDGSYPLANAIDEIGEETRPVNVLENVYRII